MDQRQNGIDVKVQAFATTANPVKADFRKSAGQFLGAPIDHHTTILEFRATAEDLERLGIGVDDVIAACKIVNAISALKVLTAADVEKMLKIDAPQAVEGAVAGIAVRVYDAD